MNHTRIRAAINFQLLDYRHGTIVMYLCVYLIILLTLLAKFFYLRFNTGVSGGLELVTMITLFVFGLTSFKDNFKFFSVNSFSRRAQFFSTAAFLGIISCICAFIDTLNGLFLTHVANYSTLFMMFYRPRIQNSASGRLLLENFLWLIFFYFCLTMIGLFITTLYYRMNKGLKIAVSIAVWAALTFGIPSLDIYIFHGGITSFSKSVASAMWGISEGYNPYIAVGSLFLFAAFFGALAYLLARKAIVKR